jgi:Protein of unknown function (DUF1592)/Protein of unknown function (DUF1588)
VLNSVICLKVNPPPAAAAMTPFTPDPTRSPRENFETRTASGSCGGCSAKKTGTGVSTLHILGREVQLLLNRGRLWAGGQLAPLRTMRGRREQGWWAVALLLAACTGNIEAPRSAPPEVQGGGGGGAEVPKACTATPARVWALTSEQYARTLGAVLPTVGSPPVEELDRLAPRLSGAFSSQAAAQQLTPPYVAELYAVASTWAKAVVKARVLETACGGKPIDAACAGDAFRPLLERSKRRAATGDEVGRLAAFFAAQQSAHGQATALELTLLTVAMAPEALFRSELGDATVQGRMTADELASALSYTLTDGPPDEELATAARSGALSEKPQIRAQARRLLGLPTVAPGLQRFFAEHFELSRVDSTLKDAQLFPDWSTAVAQAARAESTRFFEHVLREERGKFSNLFTSKVSFVNQATAPLYGLSAQGMGLSKLASAPQRSGLLTQLSVLASHGHPNSTSIVFRGKFLRDRLLCQTLTPPPVVPPLPEPAPGLRSQRERLTSLTAADGCRGCHESLNEMGFPLEQFDSIGRLRQLDDGVPIDTSGALATVPKAKVADAVDLSSKIALSPQVASCFARQAWRYVEGGLDPTRSNSCAEARLEASFARNGGDMLELFVEAVSDEAFLNRRSP